jgi:hypothetical protein
MVRRVQEEETETEPEFEAESLQASSETSSDAVSDQDDFNASEDEGSESDFEESTTLKMLG